MSDYLARNDDCLDRETHLIIHGYFRLTFQSYLVPSDIIHLTKLYVDDHFMLTRGSYQWYIDSDTLQQMKTAKTKQKFSSDKFNMCGLSWSLDAYPNGYKADDDAGNFQLGLRFSSLPSQWNYIIVFIFMKCNETESSWITTTKYTQDTKGKGWPANTMKLDEIKSLNKLSFIVSIRINKIVLKKDNKFYFQSDILIPKYTKFQWKLDHNLLTKMQQSHNGKGFISPMFHNAFCLALRHSSDGQWIQLRLVLSGLPANVSKMNLTWKISLNSQTDNLSNIDTEKTQDFAQGQMAHGWGQKQLSFEKFRNMKDVTICLDIINNDIEISKNDDIIAKWDKFIQTKDKHQSRLDLVEITLQRMTTQLQKISMIEQQLIAYSETMNKINGVLQLQQSQNNNDMIHMHNNVADEERVRMWLHNTVKLPQYYQLFIDQGFDDLETISDLTVDDLRSMGIDKLGHQKKLIKHVKKLCDTDNSGDAVDGEYIDEVLNEIEKTERQSDQL